MSKITDLASELRKLLSSGAFPPGARFLSEYEIGNRYNISRITANKAVSILAAEGLLERGKRGSGTFVRQPASFPKGWIAIVENLSSSYNTQIVVGAAQEAYQHGYTLSILRSQIVGMADIIANLAVSDCVGVIGVTTLVDVIPDDFPKPVIHLDGILDSPTGRKNHSVVCDNYNAAYEMMQHIIAAGKKEIVFVGSDCSCNRRERLNGFRNALLDNNILDAEKRQYCLRESAPHAMRLVLRKIMNDFPGVDFIATDSDDLVYRIMYIAKRDHIDCPGAIGVSGFGNLHGIADLHNIPTVDQHPVMMGAAAVNGLLEIINGRDDLLQEVICAEIVNAEYI